MSSFYKGVFWYLPEKDELIIKKVACDNNGLALEYTEYSSKSGDNFALKCNPKFKMQLFATLVQPVSKIAL